MFPGQVRKSAAEVPLPKFSQDATMPSPPKSRNQMTPLATRRHQAPPGATRRHQAPPGATRRPQAPPGATRRHQAPPGATRRHQAPPGATRRHQAPPGATRRHQQGCHCAPLWGGGGNAPPKVGQLGLWPPPLGGGGWGGGGGGAMPPPNFAQHAKCPPPNFCCDSAREARRENLLVCILRCYREFAKIENTLW